MKVSAPVIGIDFGTSYSKMAYYNPVTGQAEVLRNEQEEEVTPSAVYFDAQQTLVGRPALETLEDGQDAARLILSVKRSLVRAPLINLPDRTIKPIEVVAEILRKLKHDAEEFTFSSTTIERAVMTCPASFDELEVRELKNAGLLAGFREVEMLPEPVAAALAYTHMQEKMGLQVGDRVLIYDLGGGTFDLAFLIREANGQFRLGLEAQGIRQCGGDDFDEALYNHFDQTVQKALGRWISPTGERDLRFLSECRKRKENLTSRKNLRPFSSLLAPEARPFKFEIDQATFENLIRSIVERTVQKTQDLVQEITIHGHEVDTFVLVGGSSQIPLVKQLLETHLTLKTTSWQYRSVAVALGAAYHAYNAWSPQANTQARSQSDRYRKIADDVWRARQEETLKVESDNGNVTQKKGSGGPSAFALVHVFDAHVGPNGCVALSADGRILASGSNDHTISIWDLPARKILRVLRGHVGDITSLAITPDGRLLASGSADRTIKLWDISNGTQMYTLSDQTGPFVDPMALAISPNGGLLACVGLDSSIKFWNLTSMAPLRPLNGHGSIVQSVAFNFDGALLASGGADKTVKLWNLRTGTCLHTFHGHTANVHAVRFSPNGQLLCSGSADRSIRFWNIHSGAVLQPLLGHSGTVVALAFRHDGKYLASGSVDQTIHLWNLRTSGTVGILSEHENVVQSLAFSPDGETLISGSADTTIKLWRRDRGSM